MMWLERAFERAERGGEPRGRGAVSTRHNASGGAERCSVWRGWALRKGMDEIYAKSVLIARLGTK